MYRHYLQYTHTQFMPHILLICCCKYQLQNHHSICSVKTKLHLTLPDSVVALGFSRSPDCRFSGNSCISSSPKPVSGLLVGLSSSWLTENEASLLLISNTAARSSSSLIPSKPAFPKSEDLSHSGLLLFEPYKLMDLGLKALKIHVSHQVCIYCAHFF